MGIFAVTGLVVKVVLVILGLFSVISLGIIFYKFRQVYRANSQSERFLEFFWKVKRFDAINAQLDRFEDSPLAVLFNEGFNEPESPRRRGKKGRPEHHQHGTGRDRKYFPGAAQGDHLADHPPGKIPDVPCHHRRHRPLYRVVRDRLGIMTAFKGIGETGSASLAVVAPGIAEALIATAVGLVAAIPAVMGYNHFQHKIKVLIAEMDSFSTEYLNIVQRNFAGK